MRLARKAFWAIYNAPLLQDVWESGRALEILARVARVHPRRRRDPVPARDPAPPGPRRFDLGLLRTSAGGGADVPPELIRSAAREIGCTATRAYRSTEFPTL